MTTAEDYRKVADFIINEELAAGATLTELKQYELSPSVVTRARKWLVTTIRNEEKKMDHLELVVRNLASERLKSGRDLKVSRALTMLLSEVMNDFSTSEASDAYMDRSFSTNFDEEPEGN